MYQPFHPAILRMIRQVVKAAKDNELEVSLCGEMAGDPLCAGILLGLGIDELSMNATAIPAVKKIIRTISIEDARADLRKIFKLDTATKVREFIVSKMGPLMSELDVMNV
jgi:phosphotransferase system enzyme I (PtsI)